MTYILTDGTRIDASFNSFVTKGEIIVMMISERKFRLSWNLDRHLQEADIIAAMNDWYAAKEKRDAERQGDQKKG